MAVLVVQARDVEDGPAGRGVAFRAVRACREVTDRHSGSESTVLMVIDLVDHEQPAFAPFDELEGSLGVKRPHNFRAGLKAVVNEVSDGTTDRHRVRVGSTDPVITFDRPSPFRQQSRCRPPARRMRARLGDVEQERDCGHRRWIELTAVIVTDAGVLHHGVRQGDGCRIGGARQRPKTGCHDLRVVPIRATGDDVPIDGVVLVGRRRHQQLGTLCLQTLRLRMPDPRWRTKPTPPHPQRVEANPRQRRERHNRRRGAQGMVHRRTMPHSARCLYRISPPRDRLCPIRQRQRDLALAH